MRRCWRPLGCRLRLRSADLSTEAGQLQCHTAGTRARVASRTIIGSRRTSGVRSILVTEHFRMGVQRCTWTGIPAT